jgi:hypothetical protein
MAMIHPSPQTLQLSEADKLGPITVDAARFEIFEGELDERLNKLVDAWKHLASPNAQRIRRSVMPGNKQNS